MILSFFSFHKLIKKCNINNNDELDELLALALPVGRHLEQLELGHDVLVGQLAARRNGDFLSRLPGLGSEFLEQRAKM